MRAQQEDRELVRSLLDREARTGTASPSAPPPHMPLPKMGPTDDPEAFLDLFERTAEACGWPVDSWPVRVIPLLSGEAQKAAQQLPVPNLLVYADLRRAILQRVGLSPEQHRQRFRSLELAEAGRPFVLAQQLRDSCRKWLLAGDGDAESIINAVVLEQFISRLPKKSAQWVQCHRPASLDLAIQLAEDQLAACSGVGEPLPAVSLSLSVSPSPPLRNLSLSLGPVGWGHRGLRPAGGWRWSLRPGPEVPHEGWPLPSDGGVKTLRLLPHVNPLSHFLPLGQWGDPGQPAGVAGIRATLWTGAR
ncbi:zinc finger protein 444-like [Carassius gibelio]|uniref:zinc finger protein 444-like n=1 Tax=Carassius gibelio TaxID=101364 RepID=UPI0022781BEB|nr:zinc finger protein 444-like [Carassius gibelio]